MQVAEHPPRTTRCSSTAESASARRTSFSARQRHPAARAGSKIRYIHAETYVSDVVRAYQHKAFDDFKRYYRSLDLLLIDDIQFFNGKSRTQEEFFYLFNTLIEAHKQVVITCDTTPKEICRNRGAA
jgi:chromosomal replication initiation ATPase DnaA